ncbi:cytidylate kinase [Haloferula luteola]|uniref:Cytidylate kinase n=1 Tax=Haloferula luteola TaxID=595692 RepID=A0A840V4G1_9BACT|nr:(d)CMP kinase [Haloferula luteola]MBB5352443.1 cytidylate kinase [Haloferula luteola]
MKVGHFAIAIDGPAASGKSTLARELAQRLGLVMVNSGAMYRAVTWQVMQAGVDPENPAAVAEALEHMVLDCGVDGLDSTLTINGVDPGEALRSSEVNAHVSQVSAVPEVRRKLVELQRSYLDHSDVVMEGRDIGTAVFPETPYKIYVDADPAVRQERRCAAGEVDSVSDRDRRDSQRQTDPLRVADGARVLDNSGHTVESAVEEALVILREQGLEIPLLEP